MILDQIRKNKPEFTELGQLQTFDGDRSVERFAVALQNAGGKIIETPLSQVHDLVTRLFLNVKRIVSSFNVSEISVNEHTGTDVLKDIEVSVLSGEFGVAENGAVWLPESHMLHRSLPFITQHLVLVLHRDSIVANMHDAYARVTPGNYGAFIAGPSKTADIEQSLVIGAHGARSLTVLVV